MVASAGRATTQLLLRVEEMGSSVRVRTMSTLHGGKSQCKEARLVAHPV